MLRSEFDLLPQENFAQVFGNSFRMNPPAIKRPIIGLGLFLSLMLSLVGFSVWNYVKPFAVPADIFMHRMAVFCLAAQVLVVLLNCIRALKSRCPAFFVYAQLIESGCFRYMVCFTGAMYAADSSELGVHASELSLAVFALSEIGCNLFMFSRIADRIKRGKYRPEGTAFWDNKQQSNIVYGVLAAPACLGLIALLRSVSGICDILDVADLDFSTVETVLLAVFFVIAMIAASAAGAYLNVRQNVLLYCLRRFGEDTDGYGLDRNEPQDEENWDDEYDESEE